MADPLRPAVGDLLSAWAARVDADHEQVERCREVVDPADFYAPVSHRFRPDLRKPDDVFRALKGETRPDESWLDVGAGGGRYALPLAQVVREVIAVEPSPGMVATLREGMSEAGVANIQIYESHWPMADPPTADVGLMAHVGYDIREIGPFLDAFDASCRRLCIAVMGEAAMTTVATLFWQTVHGEPRVRLPAMPELLTLLLARGRLPEVHWVDRAAPTFETADEALWMARRQLWLTPGGEKDQRFAEVARSRLIERAGRFAFEDRVSRIGIAAWSP